MVPPYHVLYPSPLSYRHMICSNAHQKQADSSAPSSDDCEKEPPMLTLSRRANEKITFPELGITVQIVEIWGDKIRLGIEAPPEVKVLRGELAEGSNIRNAAAGAGLSR